MEAEERVIRELKALGKPFIIVLNCKDPASPDGQRLRDAFGKIRRSRDAVDVTNMQLNGMNELFESVLFEFPIRRIHSPPPG